MSSTAKLRVPVTDSDHTDGPDDARVVLVEYGDYQCPYCGEAYPIVKRLQKNVKPKFRFVFRNFPLAEMHPLAMTAARAAEAADAQGKFWAMHDVLFENQGALDEPSVLRHAKGLGLDLKAFAERLASKDVETRILRDVEGGARSGVNGTPTFFINGARFDRGYAYDALLSALKP